MTTVSYRDGIMAGDTRVTAGDTIQPDQMQKVFKLPDGSLLGVAGTCEEIEELIRAVKAKAKPPRLSGTTAILVGPRGALKLYEGRNFRRIESIFYSIGSGADLANAAMLAGCDAADAVKVAMQIDPYSGGEVRTVSLNKRKK